MQSSVQCCSIRTSVARLRQRTHWSPFAAASFVSFKRTVRRSPASRFIGRILFLVLVNTEKKHPTNFVEALFESDLTLISGWSYETDARKSMLAASPAFAAARSLIRAVSLFRRAASMSASHLRLTALSLRKATFSWWIAAFSLLNVSCILLRTVLSAMRFSRSLSALLRLASSDLVASLFIVASSSIPRYFSTVDR
ncbi:hypothetical protein BJ741DRAFT_625204 [Chytriomyces cf. hyalinus JEL632]|nr:hypothetical protein BJ741DRAFT_625204 [Chytriomyces cf. hyalinus JEL632]